MAFTLIPNDMSTWINLNYKSSTESSLAFASSSTPLGGTNTTVALLPFEQNVLDLSGNNNNGKVAGNAKYVTGKVGSYAFSFDGQTSITLPNPSQFAFDKQYPFTISFWIKMPPNNSTDMYIISNSNNPTSAGISIWKSHLSNGLTFKMQNQWGKANQVTTQYNISDNSWHLVMSTYDGSGNQKGMRIYVDGALQAVGTAATISGTLVTNLNEKIGSTVSGTSQFVGILDNVQIANYLPSPTYLQSFFGSPSLFSPLLLPPIPTKSGISLSWLPVIGAVGYNVYRDGTNVAKLEPSTSYFDSGLASNTTHSYTIVAVNSTGGTSLPAKITSTTISTSLNPSLRVSLFAPSYSTATLNVMKANYQSGDGMLSTRIPQIEKFQDSLQISGLKHFVYSPRIGPFDPSCNLGSVPSISDDVNSSLQAIQSGYYIDAVVYDIEGWCWTPLTEQQNYVSAIDNASSIVHAGGLKFGLVPTHAELLQWYTNIHWKNVDYLLIQFHKSFMTKESGYTLFDPNYITNVSTIINYARSQNPNIKIFLNVSPNWESVGSMIYAIDYFKNQIQGIVLYDLPSSNSDNTGAPYTSWNTASHQAQFLKAVKSM